MVDVNLYNYGCNFCCSAVIARCYTVDPSKEIGWPVKTCYGRISLLPADVDMSMSHIPRLRPLLGTETGMPSSGEMRRQTRVCSRDDREF